MADVSRSVSLSKKLSNAGDFSSKHIYDGVFSAPTATKLNSSAFEIRIDDYREIFSPSDASLGSSIPILDLPAVDRSAVIGRGRSSGVDYAGVFGGGLGDEDRVGVPAELLFGGSKKKARNDAHPSRSSMPTKIPSSKSQEFPHDSGNSQASKSQPKTRTTVSKSQEFCGSSREYPTSSQASKNPTKTRTTVSKSQEFCGTTSSQASKSPTKTRTTVSKSQEFCGISKDNPTLCQALKSPTKTRMTLSRSQEFCGSSRVNSSSSDVLTDQQSDSIKHLNVPHQKINQLSKDGTAGMTQIAHLHAVPGYTRTFEEASPARKTGLNKAKRMSMDDTDFSMDVSKEKRQGKHTSAVSDLGTDKQTIEHDAQLQKEFGAGECYTFDATHNTREANFKSQTFGMSPLSSSPQLFGSNDYFRRSSSQRSKSSTNNQQSDAVAGSSSPLLELDVNSTAAVSAAAVKRAIKEAEAKIRWAKEFLKGQEGDGSTKRTFKDSLKVKTTSDIDDSYEACGLKQNGTLEVEARRQNKYVAEDKLLKRKVHLSTTATSVENSNFIKAGRLELKDDLNFSTGESQLADEAGMLNEKLHGVSAQEDTAMRDCVGFRSTFAAVTLEVTHDSFDQEECVNNAVLKEKANSHEVVTSTEKSHKHEGGGEWEATKHLSQLISGVKNRLVSFMSKQAYTEKIEIQEDAPSASGSVEQYEGSTCQVQDSDDHVKRGTEQAGTEKIVIQEDAPSTSRSVEQSEGSSCQVLDANAHIKRATEQADTEKIVIQEDAPSTSGSVKQFEGSSCQVQDADNHIKGATEQADTEKIVTQEDAPSTSGSVEQSEGSSCQVQDADAHIKRATKQADTKKIAIQGDAPSASGPVEQSEGSTCQVQDADAHIKRVTDQDHVEKDVQMNYYASSGAGEIAQDSNIGMEIHKPGENAVKINVALEQGKVEDITASADVEMLISRQCDSSEPERDWEVQESIEAKGELTEEDVQDQSQEILDDYVAWEPEKDQMDTNECKEHDMEQETTYQSRGYDSKEETNCKDDDETENKVQDQEPIEKEVDESFDGKDGIRRQEEGCSWRETEMPKDSEKKLEDVQMVEEPRTDELQEGVQTTNLFTREDNKTAEHQDVKSKSTLGVTEVADDTFEHDEFLVFSKNEEACLHDEGSQYVHHLGSSSGGEERMEEPATSPLDPKMNAEQPLVFSKDKEACFHDESSQYSQRLGFSSGGEEKATCPFEPKMNVEQPICSQIATQLVSEDMCKRPSSFQVDDDVSCSFGLPAMGHICEQEQFLKRRNEDACGSDDTDEYPQDVDFTFFEKERMANSTNITSEAKGNLEQPSSVHTVNDLIRKEMYEQIGCSTEVADETLGHEECPPAADVCKKEVHSCLNGDSEGYENDMRNEHNQDVEFAFEDERMTESVAVTSVEPAWSAEQPSPEQTVTELIGEDMTETSISAGDCEDFNIVVDEIEDTHEVLPHTNFQKTQCETDVEFEQKHANEQTFSTDIGSENQGDATEVREDTREVDMASDQDIRMHDVETSYKRKRWFENRDEAGEYLRSGILLGAKITLGLDQENTQGSKVDDRVEIQVDEMVSESGEGTNVRQTDACSSLEDSCHSTEATHRRRRWFENRGQEVLHKPSVFDGAGMTTHVNDQIESELDDSLQTCVDKLGNEGKEGTDLREDDLASDQVESRATSEAAHRRRRWFENVEKLGPVQKPSILEDNSIKANQEEGTEMGEDTAKHDDFGETSTASIMENKHQNQVNEREREKERERIAVERAIREARQRAFADARERAAVEARQKAAAPAQDRQGKDSSEAKSGSDKATMDAKLRVERAAVERATAEARERALQRAMSEKAAYKSKEKDSKNQTSGPSCSSGYSSAPSATEKSSGVTSESPQRRKAISERNRRTMERAAKALEEKNTRDALAQKEQAERNRFADALDADVKRWLTGKDGNLRAMLSTLQYILGPDSGWQPIPLTDLVTSTAVRKAYKRAALCVHPDKLQQRGATVQHKYICEKVFDLLKDAWHKFNPDDW